MKNTPHIALYILAVISVVVLLFAYPYTHPDKAHRLFTNTEIPISSGQEFLASLGYQQITLLDNPNVYRHSQLLEALQVANGRYTLARQLDAEKLSEWPAYVWELEYGQKAGVSVNFSMDSDEIMNIDQEKAHDFKL